MMRYAPHTETKMKRMAAIQLVTSKVGKALKWILPIGALIIVGLAIFLGLAKGEHASILWGLL